MYPETWRGAAGFYAMSSHQSSDASRFSLWGMPLDAPAPSASDLTRSHSEELAPLTGGKAKLFHVLLLSQVRS